MKYDDEAEVFKGIIYKLDQPDDADADTVEYCIFLDAQEGDETLTGQTIPEWGTHVYLMVKFVTKGGKVGKYALHKESIKNDKDHFTPAEGRPLVKAMLRGL